MKNLTVSWKSDSATGKAVIIDCPENFADLAKLSGQESIKAFGFYMAGLEATVKTRLTHGESVSFVDLCQRAGTRSKNGLSQAIIANIGKVHAISSTLGAKLTKLAEQVANNYSGHQDEYYDLFYDICAEAKDLAADTTSQISKLKAQLAEAEKLAKTEATEAEEITANDAEVERDVKAAKSGK